MTGLPADAMFEVPYSRLVELREAEARSKALEEAVRRYLAYDGSEGTFDAIERGAARRAIREALASGGSGEAPAGEVHGTTHVNDQERCGGYDG